MKNVLIHKFGILSILLASFFVGQMSFAQTISAPDPSFQSRACQGSSDVTWEISAFYDNGSFPVNTTFNLILSNSEASFADGDITIINPLSTEIIEESTTNGEIILTIFFPEGVGGENYRFRIDSSSGVTGTRSSSYPIYVTNNLEHKTQPACTFVGLPLEAVPEDSNGDVVELDSYVWYRRDTEFSLPQLIEGANSSTYTPTEPGFYFHLERDYGDCFGSIGFRFFNQSEVRESAGSEISINGSLSRTGCSSDIITLQGLINTVDTDDLVYVWYKDGEQLEDIESDDFTVIGSETLNLTVSGIQMEGEYRVGFTTGIIDDESCTDQSETVTITLENPRIEMVSPEEVFLLAEGQTTTLEAVVIRPTTGTRLINWHKINGSTGEIEEDIANNSTSFVVSEAGTYTVSLSADTDCPEDNFVYAEQTVTVSILDSVDDIIIGFANDDYEACESEQAVLEVQSVTVSSGTTSQIIEGDDLENLTFEWERDGSLIEGETNNDILINSASDNGTYKVFIGETPSNEVTVTLALDSFTLSAEPEFIEDGGSSTLSLGLEDTTDYFFQWFRNNQELVGETSENLTVTEAGLYRVEVTHVECGTQPFEINVNSGSPVIPNVITPNNDGNNDDWVLPSTYNNATDVEINIYTSGGQLDYSGNNYNGNWPDESQSNAVGTIYYYIITNSDGSTEQGSITIIR